MVDRFEEASFGAGAPIVSAGAPAQLLVVVSGQVAVMPPEVPHLNDLAQVALKAIETLRPGQLHGSRSLLQNTPMEHRLVALETSQLHRVSHNMVQQVLGGGRRGV